MIPNSVVIRPETSLLDCWSDGSVFFDVDGVFFVDDEEGRVVGGGEEGLVGRGWDWLTGLDDLRSGGKKKRRGGEWEGALSLSERGREEKDEPEGRERTVRGCLREDLYR